MKFRLRGRLLIPTFVLVAAALLQSGPLWGQSSTAPASSAADDAAKRLLWLKSRGLTSPAPAHSTASATPAPASTPAPAPAPPKRFAVSRSPDLRSIDLPGATTPAPSAKSSTTTPPATASTTPRPESTETPAKKSTASSKASATPAATPKSKKGVASKSPGTTPAPSTTASTSTDKPAKTTAAADPTTPAPAKDSTPAPSHTAKTKPASPTPSISRTAKISPETTPAPSKDSTPAPSRTAKSTPASPTPSASRTAKTSPETTPAPSKTAASTSPTIITSEPTPKKSTPGTKPTETPAVTAKSKKGATEKPLATAATPTPVPTTPHPIAAKSTPAPKQSTPSPKLASTAASSTAAHDLLSIPAQNAKLSMPARTTSISPIPTPDPYRLPPVNRSVGGRFPWKTSIVTTVFWVGERPTANNPTPNHASSWDMNWARSFGGYDNPDPDARRNFIPVAFTPRQNPFYVALPYNDVTRGTTKPESRLVIPWFKSAFEREGKSVCRDRWVAIRARSGKVAYGQWSDCGPFRTDHWQYVFGNERPRPNLNGGAGLDVSPAIRDFLGISSTDVTDWKFVDDRDVPPGPWARHGENNTFAQGNRR